MSHKLELRISQIDEFTNLGFNNFLLYEYICPKCKQTRYTFYNGRQLSDCHRAKLRFTGKIIKVEDLLFEGLEKEIADIKSKLIIFEESFPEAQGVCKITKKQALLKKLDSTASSR